MILSNKLNGNDYNEIKNKINDRFNLGEERQVLDLEVMSSSSNPANVLGEKFGRR